MEPAGIESTCEAAKEVKPLERESIHRICSGQVVLSLAIAVKELVENSLDAGATLVEVKLKKQGLESIEVVDNGSGVAESNFEALTAKHYTSKLREFEDLRSVDTFGFRGEALSSLCALCDVIITTRHTAAVIGTKLEFDHYGKIKKRTSCARTVGTTVLLTNIFGTLPVRQRELSKNIKTEFNKICQILRAYCLVAKGVRIICTNQNSKGIWQTFLCTRGSNSVLKSIEDIYGTKLIQDLMEIKQAVEEGDEDEKCLELEDLNDSLNMGRAKIELADLAKFNIEGWISSCDHGHGSKLKDKQYFYVNSRPCDPKQVAKAVNEVYHRYNNREFPFVYLNIVTPKCDVDVNLTPDKRQLLVNNEKTLLLAIKLALAKTYKHVQSTFKANDTIHKVETKNNASSQEVDEDDLVASQDKFKEVLSRWKATGSTESYRPLKKDAKRKQNDEITMQKLKLAKIQKYLESNCESASASSNVMNASENRGELMSRWRSLSPEPKLEDETDLENSVISDLGGSFSGFLPSPLNQAKVKKSESLTTETLSNESQSNIPSPQIPESEVQECKYVYDDEENADENKTFSEIRTTITTSIEEIERSLQNEEQLEKTCKDKAKLSRLKFKAEINPSKNKNAEEELDRGITKDMFSKMEIIGQFNLGFIIVKLDEDLFIVDQHATDEMYNFEMLRRSTQLHSQKLAIAQPLEFTTVNEMILMDNLDVFKANGFEFEIDPEGPATRRVKLLTKPFSRNWEFGKNDIDELVFMLHDAPPNTMCRPSRIRSMFASRACRKSVMIGTALKTSTMKQLVNHMGEVEKPWNCPHGRPTMRHLVNLAMLRDET